MTDDTPVEKVKQSDGELVIDFAGRIGARPYARYEDGQWHVLSLMHVPTVNYGSERREVLTVKATPDSTEDEIRDMVGPGTKVINYDESPFPIADGIPHRDDVDVPYDPREDDAHV